MCVCLKHNCSYCLASIAIAFSGLLFLAGVGCVKDLTVNV